MVTRKFHHPRWHTQRIGTVKIAAPFANLVLGLQERKKLGCSNSLMHETRTKPVDQQVTAFAHSLLAYSHTKIPQQMAVASVDPCLLITLMHKLTFSSIYTFVQK